MTAHHEHALNSPALSIGVIGAKGGVGASVFAAALAAVAARRQLVTAIIDGDRSGGGLDVLLGIEDEPGLRWPDLYAARGQVHSDHILPLLPGWRGAHVLSADRTRPTPLAAEIPHDVVSALQSGCDVIIHDLARHSVREWMPPCCALIIIGQCDVLTVAGAIALSQQLSETGQKHGLIIRRPAVTDIDPLHIARAAGLDLWGELRSTKNMRSAIERGHGPDLQSFGPIKPVRKKPQSLGHLAELVVNYCATLRNDLL